MTKHLWLPLLLSAVCLACHQPPEAPLHLVCLLDVTGSVTAQGRATSFEVIHALLEKLQRGDSLIVIPVTDDAEVEGPGQILRFNLGKKRQAYDADLRQLAKDAEARLQELLASATTNPHQHTDILGTVRLAGEEFSFADKDALKVLVCLSDFIQDNAQFDFKSDRMVANEHGARELASMLAGTSKMQFQKVEAYLGMIGSKDLKKLDTVRRNAIRSFWIELLKRQGANVTWATDGSGKLARFFDQLNKERISND
ncbi:hypothetical protein MYX78_01090 [Acidobacteria bacterium AH-259-G07]|nr:hypothetical protein [Acidobacteria bacterium AH-259-G07]